MFPSFCKYLNHQVSVLASHRHESKPADCHSTYSCIELIPGARLHTCKKECLVSCCHSDSTHKQQPRRREPVAACTLWWIRMFKGIISSCMQRIWKPWCAFSSILVRSLVLEGKKKDSKCVRFVMQNFVINAKASAMQSWNAYYNGFNFMSRWGCLKLFLLKHG